jgi:NAD(P)-dependent dehydrogenase (short-subunit alcohol dehydrogenase family)
LASQQPLQNNVCLVTGAARKLGADIVRALAGQGAAVAVNYLESAGAARALIDELSAVGARAEAFQADVSDPVHATRLVEAVWEELGAIDVLVNNAGPFVDTPLLELPTADFDRIMATNVRATFMLSQLAGRRMKARAQGRIINIAATDVFHRSHSVYGLAKAGVVYLTEALACELAPEVRVNAVAPGLIAENEDMDPEFEGQILQATPLGRLATRAEIAEMVCLLCTPAFDSVTGQTIVMDGGHRIPRLGSGS